MTRRNWFEVDGGVSRREFVAAVAGTLVGSFGCRGEDILGTVAPVVWSQEMSTGKQLLFDDRSIAHRTRLERLLFPVAPDPDRPVLSAERAWEFPWGVWVYGSVLKDAATGTLWMWYQTLPRTGGAICVARSLDGVVWQRVDAAYSAQFGSNTNIVRQTASLDANCPSVVVDPADVGTSRYMRLYYWDRRHVVAYSRTGMQFEDARIIDFGGSPLGVPSAGDVLSVTYDRNRGRRLAFIKIPRPLRTVGLSECKEGEAWTPTRPILQPDQADAEAAIAAGWDQAEFYGLAGFPYDGMYVGFLWVLRSSRRPGPNGHTLGAMHLELVYSYDGHEWERAHSRAPLVLLGPPGSYRAYIGATASNPVVFDDEVWVYCTCMTAEHGLLPPEAVSAICRARFRRDGWVGLRAGDEEGMLESKGQIVTGGSLLLNVRAPGGYLRAEMADANGTPIPGFEAANAIPLKGDAVRAEAMWKGSASLEEHLGRYVRLRLWMRNAVLYSWTL